MLFLVKQNHVKCYGCMSKKKKEKAGLHLMLNDLLSKGSYHLSGGNSMDCLWP